MYHERLLVWQEAMQLVVSVYEQTQSFPRVEQYGLAQQLRRAAVSIISNVAEGSGRSSRADRNHFFVMARGSLREVEAQLTIAMKLGFIPEVSREHLDRRCQQTGRLLSGLIRSTLP